MLNCIAAKDEAGLRLDEQNYYLKRYDLNKMQVERSRSGEEATRNLWHLSLSTGKTVGITTSLTELIFSVQEASPRR